MQNAERKKDKSQTQIAFSWIGTQKLRLKGDKKAKKSKIPSHTKEKQTCVQLQMYGNTWWRIMNFFLSLFWHTT